MKKLMVSGVMCGVIAMAVAGLGAQDKMGDKMGGMGKMDKMAAEKSYTGCLAKSAEGAYSLTHAMADDTMTSSMSNDAMKHDAMKNDGMKNDGMKHDAMAKDMKDMKDEALALSSSAVDLSQHVGHKVTVTGVEGAKKDAKDGMLAPFTVKSLKMLNASCS